MREQLYKYDGYSKIKAKSLPEQWLVEHKLSLNRCVSKCPSVLVISAFVVFGSWSRTIDFNQGISIDTHIN